MSRKKENINFHARSSHRMQDSKDATNASLATKLSAQQTCYREREIEREREREREK
jgi:hypothetical protein